MELPIRLDQYLKYVGLAQTGGHAKYLISEGLILVNGVVEHRRGKKLYEGDKVSYEEKVWVVSK